MLTAISRRQVARCISCNEGVASEISYGCYIIYLAYTHFLFAILGIPVVLGVVAKDWAIAGTFLAMFIFLCWPVAAYLHANWSKIERW